MEKELGERLDEVITGIELGLGMDDCYWSAIEEAVRVLKVVKGLQGNIVGLSDEDFESMILKAIKG